MDNQETIPPLGELLTEPFPTFQELLQWFESTGKEGDIANWLIYEIVTKGEESVRSPTVSVRCNPNATYFLVIFDQPIAIHQLRWDPDFKWHKVPVYIARDNHKPYQIIGEIRANTAIAPLADRLEKYLHAHE